MSKRKPIGSHYDFPDSDGEEDVAQHPGNMEHMLRESTQVDDDGCLHHAARLVPVPASPTKRASDAAGVRVLYDADFFHPEPEPATATERDPVYEQPGGVDSDDEGGRDLRDSPEAGAMIYHPR